MLLNRIILVISQILSAVALLSAVNKLYRQDPVNQIRENSNKNNEEIDIKTPRTIIEDDGNAQNIYKNANNGGTERSGVIDITSQQQANYIRQRPIQDFQITNMLLASDIEGGLHALNRDTGEKLWSIEGEEPLVQIASNFSLHDEQEALEKENLKEGEETISNLDMLWVVEPYGDGSLFFFNRKIGLNKLPVSISTLVMQSPFALNNDDTVYTGIRRSSLFSIDLATGEIIQSYGGSSCSKKEQFVCDESNFNCANVILIGKTTYELTIHSRDDVSWNVTYSTWGPNNIDIDLADQNKYPLDGTYIAPFHDSTILAINTNSKIAKWVSQLPNTVVNVFDILTDYNKLTKTHSFITIPHPLKPPEGFNENGNKGTYLDMTHGGSWFAMSSDCYPSLVQSAPTSRYSLSERYRTAATKLNSFEELRDSIIGVHPTNQEDEAYATKAAFGYPTSFPSEGQLIDARPQPLHRTDEIGTIDNFNPLDSRSRSSWLGLPSSSQQQPALQIDPSPVKKGFFDTVFGKFLFRCLENLMMLFIFGLVGFIAIRMRWIPSLKTLLKKNGLELKELEPVEIKMPKILNSLETLSDEKSGDENFISSEDESESVRIEGVVDSLDSTERQQDKSEKPKKEVKIIEPEDKPNNSDAPKKRKRGSRGGKKSKKQINEESKDLPYSVQNSLSTIEEGQSLVTAVSPPTTTLSSSSTTSDLKLSDTVLGYGSYGTVVFKGTFQNRDVAIKRMLIDFYDVASQEINLLTESDDHPNVIRYFYSETNDRFLFIALELCSASLEDVLEKTHQHQELIGMMDPVNVLEQITKGLHHLHSLKIVHRDIKPQNILVAPPKMLKSKTESKFTPVRIMISDFGLCKKLEADESSFKATTQHAAGTSGWRAPELLIEDTNANNSASSDHSFSQSTSNSLSEALAYDYLTNRKLTRAIDIFSLGCCFYYILSNGSHPFGDRYLREGNVIKNIYSLDHLNLLPDNVEESKDLISKMISRNPKLRPNTQQVLKHPFFWSNAKKLEFLLKVSDRFEIEKRDPPSELLSILEAVAPNVFGDDWCIKFENSFMENLGKFRKYRPERLMDLLRALRNKYHHFNDLPENLRAKMSPLPDGFYRYFNKKFPNLLMEIYHVVEDNLKEDRVLELFF